MHTFETPRLHLRPYTPDDFEFAYRMHSSPEIMHYIKGAEPDREVVRARTAIWLKYQQENPGYGVWMMEAPKNTEVIGYGVIRHVEYTPGNEIEIGYVITREHWGKGYATEAVEGMITYALASLGVKTLVAFTDEANNASNRVLEKCGFSRRGIQRIYEADCLAWRRNF